MSMRVSILVLVGLLVLCVAASAANPIVGTWKMNVAKSTAVGTDKAQSHVSVYKEEPGGAIKFVSNIVDAKGAKIQRSWVSKRDGKDVPFNSDIADTINLTVSQDGYLGTWVIKKGGKVTGQGKSIITKDGKTMTWTWSGMSPEGKPASGTSVFERQ